MRAIPLVLAAAAVAAALTCSASPTRLSQAEAETAVAAVLPDLQKMRGITFTKKVPVTVIGDAKAREYALARFKRMTPDSKIRTDQTAFQLLGLVPKDMDVLKALLDVLEEQAGGFYDPTTKSFYLLDDMPKDMTTLLAAHEMTHALEDQRYDIDKRILKVLDDDDASFALSAVVEGSATIASAIYVAKAVAAGTLDAERLGAMNDTLQTERLNAMPDALKRQLLGPYVLGTVFLAHDGAESLAEGFPKDDVNAAWASLPRSSEQILHPEKYWDTAKRDDPKRVTIPNPKAVLPGFTLSGGGVLGELTLGSLLGMKAPEPSALASGGGVWTNAAATGWGGDRFELWTSGATSVCLLLTVWDTAKDATEFEAALPSRAELGVRRMGSRVAIVAGVAGERRDALLSLLVAP